MRIAFWGSSLVSAYWNGAATYYRGILRGLANLGHEITFFEPNAYDRQNHRDMEDPEWARIIVYDPSQLDEVGRLLTSCRTAHVVVKASGVGVLDEYLEARISSIAGDVCRVFWDVDAPATLDRMAADPGDSFRRVLLHFDAVFTYGGGDPVVKRYRSLGAQRCIPIYNGLDPDLHHQAAAEEQFAGDLSFLGNRLPDREARVEEFFLRAASLCPHETFVLGGNGWHDKPVSQNVRYVGHVYTSSHNAFNCSAKAVLNISRESMARYGFSPATRVFEAAGAAACLITDSWEGIDCFLRPNDEVLVAHNGEQVAAILHQLTPERARAIGEAARRRVLADHTYKQRGKLVHASLEEIFAERANTALAVHA